MNIYKALLSTIIVLSVPYALLAVRCQSCAEKIALKKSIAEALAAAIAVEKEAHKDIEKCGCNQPRPQVQPVAVPRPSQQSNVRPSQNAPRPSKPTSPRPNTRDLETGDIDSLEIIDEEYRCQACAERGLECTNKHCMCDQALRAPISMTDDALLTNECCPEISMCSLVDELRHINKAIKAQKRAARRCCSRLRTDIENSEDLVISQITQSTGQVNNLIISQIDQSADCCSILDVLIGDPDTTPVAILTNPASITDFVDNAELDMLTWLKSIYELVANIYICTCL